MRTLFLLRHAKSSWSDTQLDDFDRPLNERGIRSAPFIGEIMVARGYRPDLIISSPAKRAKSTSLLVCDVLSASYELRFDNRIYESSPGTLLEVTLAIPNDYSSAMLVGHNPGMEGFIKLLTGDSEQMPTASLAVIEIDVDSWKNVRPGGGKLREIIRPKDELKKKHNGD